MLVIEGQLINMTDSDSGAHVTDVSEVTSQESDSDLRKEGKKVVLDYSTLTQI